MAGEVAGHHAQQSADLQPRNGTLLGIMPSKVSVPGRTRTLLGIMPSNAWGLQTECSLLLGMMPSNAPGLHWQHVTGHHAQQWTHVFFSCDVQCHIISKSVILATHSIKTSATSFSADPSRFRFLSALMSECRQMKMNKCFWHFLVFGDLTGRPSGKKFAMSKDQKILWERNHTVKRIKESQKNALCLRFLYTVKHLTLWKKYSGKNITLWKLSHCQNLTLL